jgi:hypothetical protein
VNGVGSFVDLIGGGVGGRIGGGVGGRIGGWVGGGVGGRIGGGISGCRTVDCIGYHEFAAKVQQCWRVLCRLVA